MSAIEWSSLIAIIIFFIFLIKLVDSMRKEEGYCCGKMCAGCPNNQIDKKESCKK